MPTITVHNGSHKSSTLRALQAAAKAAKGKARSTIQALHDGLKSNPSAARGRHSQGASMAKRKKGGHKRAATKKRARTRTNPTTAAASRGFSLKGIDIVGLAMRGAAVAGGSLGQAFVARQVARFVPSLPGVAHQLIGSAAVAGAAVFFGGKGLAEDAAIGAISAGLTGLAHEFMPGVFAGTEQEAYVAGFEDGSGVNGYDEEGREVAGLFEGDYPALSVRPDGL